MHDEDLEKKLHAFISYQLSQIATSHSTLSMSMHIVVSQLEKQPARIGPSSHLLIQYLTVHAGAALPLLNMCHILQILLNAARLHYSRDPRDVR